MAMAQVSREQNNGQFKHRKLGGRGDEPALRESQLLRGLRPGQVQRGKVTSLRRFGAFVDLGGIEGLIHVSELSWRRVHHPHEVLQIGQEVEVYVLGVDHKRRRIRLSLKRLQPDPWAMIQARYYPGQRVIGTVTDVVDFGAFVRIEPGVVGLVHISELANEYISRPNQVVRPGQAVRVEILSLEPARRRMSLSLRRVPAEKRYPDLVSGEACNPTRVIQPQRAARSSEDKQHQTTDPSDGRPKDHPSPELTGPSLFDEDFWASFVEGG